MATTLPQRRPSNLFGKRFTTALLMVALVGLAVSPAAALPPGVGIVGLPRVAVDPCTVPLQLTAESPSIGLGASTRLHWSAPSGCGYVFVLSASPLSPQSWNILLFNTLVAPQGFLDVSPAFTTAYTLSINAPNSSSATVTVEVNLPLANPLCPDMVNVSTISLMTVPTAGLSSGAPAVSPPPCRRKVTINSNDLAPLLVQALGTPNTTVIVPDGVELDLSPHLGGPITIADGVQLIGGRVAEPGKRFQRGPHLFVTPSPVAWGQSHWPDPLFKIDGDNVRISGVRLEGPGAPPDEWTVLKFRPQCPPNPMDPKFHGCVQGETRGIRFFDRINIVIDHNEFSGWNMAAVEAAGIGTDDPLAVAETTPVWQNWTSRVTFDSSGLHYPAGLEPVYIHDNYFHHNFYPPKPGFNWTSCSPASPTTCLSYDGYGVVVSGTHALIERNVFNDFFHAIAANGCPGSGYRAYRNLVLGTGAGVEAFNVHYRRTECGDSTQLAAGHDFDVRYNSFLYGAGPAHYETGPALDIDGTPDVGAFISFNVFANDHVRDSAVVNSNHGGWAKVTADGTNLVRVTSWDHWDSCDFDGDGINDHFITTGVTWWYRSGDTRQGPTPWIYLNTAAFLVPQVSAVPASSHPGCDVYTGPNVFPGGVGQ